MERATEGLRPYFKNTTRVLRLIGKNINGFLEQPAPIETLSYIISEIYTIPYLPLTNPNEERDHNKGDKKKTPLYRLYGIIFVKTLVLGLSRQVHSWLLT